LDFFIFVLNLDNFKAVNILTQNDRSHIFTRKVVF